MELLNRASHETRRAICVPTASFDAIVFPPRAHATDGPATALPWMDHGPCVALLRS